MSGGHGASSHATLATGGFWQSWRARFALICAAIAALSIWYMMPEDQESASNEKVAQSPLSQYQKDQILIARKWQLCWKKTLGSKSKPNEPDHQCPIAHVTEYDQTHFTITVQNNGDREDIKFVWNKFTEPLGTWKQTSTGDGGIWYLNQISPDYFEGEYRDHSGQGFVMSLKVSN